MNVRLIADGELFSLYPQFPLYRQINQLLKSYKSVMK